MLKLFQTLLFATTVNVHNRTSRWMLLVVCHLGQAQANEGLVCSLMASECPSQDPTHAFDPWSHCTMIWFCLTGHKRIKSLHTQLKQQQRTNKQKSISNKFMFFQHIYHVLFADWTKWLLPYQTPHKR